MPATKNNVYGSCFGWTALVLLFVSLVVPWYTWTYGYSFDGESCTWRIVFFWAHVVCTPSGACGSESCPEPVVAFWTENQDNHFAAVYAPTLFLMLFATIFALVATLFFSVRCCCMRAGSSTSSALTTAVCLLGALGLVLLTLAIVVFAATAPLGWDHGHGNLHLPGPWDSFIGTQTLENEGSKLELTWAPVGWWFALVAWPFFLATTIALFFAFKARERGYSLINN
ncbi:hypothetical protein QOT17_014162 [Balamuthia mandrillaris]